jgi:copper chaperone NosL
MSRIIVLLALLPLFACATVGAGEIIENPKACKECGMDRTAFALSRMVVTYVDGTTSGVCSIRCAAFDMRRNRNKEIRSLQVADYPTRQLIDARSALWVVGGKIRGVMTDVPKWAFAGKENAESFIRENGGEITPFDQVLKLADKELDAFSDPDLDDHHDNTHDHK